MKKSSFSFILFISFVLLTGSKQINARHGFGSGLGIGIGAGIGAGLIGGAIASRSEPSTTIIYQREPMGMEYDRESSEEDME